MVTDPCTVCIRTVLLKRVGTHHLRRCIADTAPQELGEEHALTLANFAKAIVKRLENMSLGTKRKVPPCLHSPPCRPSMKMLCVPSTWAACALQVGRSGRTEGEGVQFLPADPQPQEVAARA